MRYLTQSKLSPQAWEACRELAGEALPYGSFAWMRAVANGRFGALVWEDENGYRGLLPLPEKRKLGLLPYVAMPPFTQRLGLVTGPGENPIRLAAEAAAYLRRHYLRVHLALEQEEVARTLSDRVEHRRNLVLGLNRPLTELEAGFGKSIRQKIRQSVEAGLTYEPNPGGLSAFSFIRQQLAPRIPGWDRYYDYAWGRLGLVPDAPYRVEGRLAFQNQDLVAAAVFIRFRQRIIYLAGASSPAGLACGAMAGLLHQVITENAATDLILDFEGGNMGGTSRFFSMFGAQEEAYWSIRLGL